MYLQIIEEHFAVGEQFSSPANEAGLLPAFHHTALFTGDMKPLCVEGLPLDPPTTDVQRKRPQLPCDALPCRALLLSCPAVPAVGGMTSCLYILLLSYACAILSPCPTSSLSSLPIPSLLLSSIPITSGYFPLRLQTAVGLALLQCFRAQECTFHS